MPPGGSRGRRGLGIDRSCGLHRYLPRYANPKVALLDLDIREVGLVEDLREIADHDLVDPGGSVSHAFSSPLYLFGGTLLRRCQLDECAQAHHVAIDPEATYHPFSQRGNVGVMAK